MQDLYDELGAASLEDPKAFTDSVLRLLVDQLKLAAGSFYVYSPDTATLRLKAQVGFNYSDYVDFQLPLDSFPGQAIAQGQPVVDAHPEQSPMFRDKQLLAGKTVGGVVAAPLPLSGASHQTGQGRILPPDPIGALCLYPHRSADLRQLAEWTTKYGAFLGRLYLATLERYTMHFRSATVERAAFTGDIGSLAYKFLELIQMELSVRTAALWIFDHRRNHIYLRKSIGNNHGIHDRDVTPVRLTDVNLIADCFSQQSVILHTRNKPTFTRANIPDELSLPRANGALFPIHLPPDAKIRGRATGAAGVLMLVDRHMTAGNSTHLTDFNWEDRFLAEFGCEMLSVLLFQALRTKDYESVFERRMHGVSTGLQSARSNLQFLERFDMTSFIPPAQTHYIANAIDWLEDVEAQISRDEFVGSATLDKGFIPLYGDVLAKIEPMVRRMATRDHEDFEVLGLDLLADEYRHLPKVIGDRKALNCVFRNLVNNSLKYCAPDKDRPNQLAIEASTTPDGDYVIVRVEDNGIGIPQEDAPLVFEDGFRGVRAASRRPQGIGRGLFECKAIMQKLDGDIALVTPQALQGAAFEVRLRVSRSSTVRRSVNERSR